MKKLLSLLSVFVVMFTLIALTGCSCSKKEEETIMNISCNPSVEFILDKDNKVVSVTALNEDGNVIIVGEAFIGKTAEEAAELFTKVAKETGFIIEGALVEGQNEIKISLSGDSKKAEEIYEGVKNKVSSYLSSNNITFNIENIEAPSIDEIKALVKENYTNLTNEELNNLSEKELINYLKEVRIQTKDLYSQGLKDAYTSMKDYEVDFAKNEKTLQIIEDLDASYQTTINNYTNLINAVNTAKQTLEKARYDYLIKEDSLYKTSQNQLTDAKDELVAKKNEVAAMEEGPLKELAKVQITALETAFTTAENTYNTQYTIINNVIDTALITLDNAQAAIVSFEENLPSEIKTILQNKTQEIETAVNTAKDNMFENFEETYSDQIEAAKNEVLARKEALKLSLAQN